MEICNNLDITRVVVGITIFCCCVGVKEEFLEVTEVVFLYTHRTMDDDERCWLLSEIFPEYLRIGFDFFIIIRCIFLFK